MACSKADSDHQGALYKKTDKHYRKDLESVAFYKALIDLNKNQVPWVLTKEQFKNYLSK